MGRITLSPSTVLYSEIDRLLKNLYTTARDREKRDALKRIVTEAMSQRAAFTNSSITSALTFILLNAIVEEAFELTRLERQLTQAEDTVSAYVQAQKSEK